MIATKFVSAIDKVGELLRWGVLWEDTHLINEIEGEFMNLKLAINKEGKAVDVAELACKAKSYNKLENMPLIILSLLPVNIQKQYVTAMINTPLLAIRWLYACGKYSPEDYSKAETLLDMLTLKFRDKAFTRDMFKDITKDLKSVNAYHRDLVKTNRVRINQENWLYNIGTRSKFHHIIPKDKTPDAEYDNSSIEQCIYEMGQMGILTKEQYEESFKTANILDLLAYMNVAMKLGVDPELIKAYIKKELLTNKNIVLSKIFLAMKQNGEWLYKEHRTLETQAEEELAAKFQRDFYATGRPRYDIQEEIMKPKSVIPESVIKHIIGYRDFEKAYVSETVKNDPRNMIYFLEDILFDALNKLRRIPGTGIFGLDCSGSMRGSSVGEHLPCELFDLAIIMAYQGHMAFEKSKIILSAGRDGTGGKHELLDEIYGKAPLKLGEFMVWLKKAYFNSKIGGGGIYTKQLMEYIKEKVKPDRKDNVIIYCDSGDVAARMYEEVPSSSKKVIDHCNVWIINVEYGTRGRSINYDEFGADFYVRGHSDYLLELISSVNGVASVYEKGAAVGGASFRGLF